MLLAYLTLFSGLLISGVAIYYSVAGLTAIFSAAVWPIIIMGVSLEIAKLVATVWIKQNWETSPRFLKVYLLGAVVALMFITSLGIFGFLSKAHSDQTLVSGDVQSKIAIYDEKIKTAKENIDANRKALKQMDEAVDQVMGRSSDEKGADKAVALRRGQAKERTRLLSEITAEQKTIAQLSEERAPIAAEVRKVESEVGPIKYIASFIYGDNPDANILERAVTWVIILIVIVFDPLAVSLLLASQYSFALVKKKPEEPKSIDDFVPQPKEYIPDPEPTVNAETTSMSEIEPWNDRPIPSFLLKKDQEELEVHPDEGAIEPEPKKEIIYQILEDVDEEFLIETPDNPIVITHTSDSVLIEDSAGMQEIPVEKPKVTPIGSEYVMVDGKMYHHKAFDHQSASADHVVEKHSQPVQEQTYIQNEEQKDSGVWTQISSKTITEEEYLKAVQEKQQKG